MKNKIIRGKGTLPEKLVRRVLIDKGFTYKLNVKDLPGKPDILIKGTKKIIMINGCFWHRHACNASLIPKKNREHWTQRLQYNQMRDFFVLTQLVLLEYDFIILWECEIRQQSSAKLNKLLCNFISSNKKYEFINSKREEYYDK